MSNEKSILTTAIKIAKDKNSKIDIEYKDLPDSFYYLKISADTIDGGRKNYIFSHEPYSELETWSPEKLADRILCIAEHSWLF